MYFKCAQRAPATDQETRRAAGNGSKTLTVDIHCHRECDGASEMMKAEAERVGFAALSFGSDLTKEVNAKQLEYIRPKMESLDERLADMDRMGVDIQAISVSPYQFYYWAEPEPGRAAARLINDSIAGAVAAHPDRFVGLGSVPLQNTEMAVAELQRCVKDLGLRGVEIHSRVGDEELSSPRLEPFFAKAEELDILIFIHTAGYSHTDRLTEHYFLNIIGHPIEATMAISHLIFDGVMDRHPGLKVCVAHGGGYLPAYAGRMDHAYHARPDVRDGLPLPPGEYLKRFYFDSMVFEPDQLQFLIDKYDAEHVLLGTDYPYDMGEDDPLGLIGRVPGLDQASLTAIRGGNAAGLLKLNTE
ncbi:MAG: amidohydrolase family protein [Rhodospirillales bacterium]|mgnify:CR=1 FL=1|jgi:aminocarboxymuconate-semialdehyde decarboxylase|nr:aminocarboxymuconate-semialdehyde decarboxylase [Rhodospirillaceae bacterium]MDP6426990.1 amidohydrolase family protein [Rhodospirillales bacterium]MDP6644648.1 amidohydrolase family protein [Rhodospirillales bacterium]